MPPMSPMAGRSDSLATSLVGIVLASEGSGAQTLVVMTVDGVGAGAVARTRVGAGASTPNIPAVRPPMLSVGPMRRRSSPADPGDLSFGAPASRLHRLENGLG